MTAETEHNLPAAWRALAALSLGFFMSLLDQTTVAVALPTIAAEFDVGYATAAWVSSAYLLAVVVPLVVSGRLGDRFGHRRLFLGGIAVFTAGAVASASASGITLLIVCRFIQGLGAAALMPQTMAVINQVFPRSRRGAAYGAWGVVGSLAALTGPVLAGILVASGGWRAIFWLHLPLGIAALILGALWIPRGIRHKTPIDALSVVYSLLGLTAVVTAVQEGLDSPALILLGVVGLAAVVAFLLRQRRPGALIPLRLFSVRNFSVGVGTIVVMGVVASSTLIPLMAWLQDVRGLGADAAGWFAAPMAVVGFVMGPICGILSDRVPPKTMHLIGFTILGIALTSMAVGMYIDAPLWFIVLTVTGLGFGQSFIWAANAAAVLGDIPGPDMGAASGVYNTSRQLGGVVGVAITGAVLATAGAAPALFVLAGVVFAGLIAAGWFRSPGMPGREAANALE